MLSGDNSILQRATEAKELTDKAQIVEQAKLDILAKIAENKGQDPKEDEIKEILETYFTEDSVNALTDLTTLTQKLTTKSGGYTVELSEVLNGVAIAKDEENNETPILKSTATTDSYVGYYADIDNDGDVDGIIYADMIVGNTKSGRWNNDDWSDYNVTQIEDVTTVKDYVVSSWTYDGQTTAGKYNFKPKDDAEGFGEKEVLVPATYSTGTKDRFYLMTLEDFSVKDSENTDITKFYWYKSANGKLDDTIETSAVDFGEGKAKTIKEINRWNAKTYGDQNERDLWGVIQNKIGATKDADEKVTDCKWFVPSKAEWSAFGEELGITTDNYVNKGFSDWYWSSSQYKTTNAYNASFGSGCMNGSGVNNYSCVRMSATF